ncbi:MAG: TIGR04372 family glycosyltransferase [Hyphomicrobiales bacterium]|nr:TIGR04372 family glycosyltransferase [Hyphomicrobiales bacterium]
MSDSPDPDSAGPETLRDLYARHAADPEDYDTNRKLGMLLSGIRKTQIHGEPFLLRALAHKAAAGQMRDHQAVAMLDRLAMLLMAKGDYAAAEDIAAQLVTLAPGVPELWFRWGDVLFRLGRVAEASDAFARTLTRMRESARAAAARRGGPVTHLLSPHKVIARYFGETAAKLDLYLKARELGLLDRADPVLLAPAADVANPALFDYWGRHARVVRDPAEIAQVQADLADSQVYLDYIPLPDGRTLHRDVAHRVVQALWEAAGRGPLLTLDPGHRRAGRERLARAGLPEDAWFVCLHVREAGFFDEDVAWSNNRHRNARVETYLPAVAEVVARGGHVVRIGDPTMTPLPGVPGLIDYAHGGDDLRADWMDLVCVAEARFYLGMASGPSSVAVNFGVPTLGTNWFPLGPWPYCAGDIFIHKRLRDTATGRFLGIAESLAPPLFSAMAPLYFQARGLEPVDNTADEIRAATREMLDRLDGTWTDTAEDDARQARYRALADPHGVGLTPRLGRDFLAAHPELLD